MGKRWRVAAAVSRRWFAVPGTVGLLRTARGQLRTRIRQQAALAELAQVALQLPLLEIYEDALNVLRGTLRVDCGSLAAFTGTAMEILSSQGWAGQNDQPIPLDERAISTWAIRQRQPVVVEDFRTSADFSPPPDWRHPGLRSGLSVPISVGASVFGTIAVFATKARGFSADDIHFVKGVASVIAGAIEREHANEALDSSEERYRTIVEVANEGIVQYDVGGRHTYVNRRFCEMFGYTEVELLDMTMLDLMFADDAEVIRRSNLPDRPAPTRREMRLRRKDGTPLWALVATTPLHDYGIHSGSMAVLTDVSERKAAEEALVHQAQHDALTSLPNRNVLYDRLEECVLNAENGGPRGALLFIDLDGFKHVNDAFGHQVGDLLLQEVGVRLYRLLRSGETVARLGGDEFAVILPGCSSAEAAGAAARQLLDRLGEPLDVDGHPLTITASVGIVMFPQHGHDVDTLMRRADGAMYEAKRQRLGAVLFSNDRNVDTTAGMVVTSELRQALRADLLNVVYQPKMDLRTNQIVGVEALARWVHPELGVMPPEQFIALAESNRLIDSLTWQVVEKVCQQLVRWQDRGFHLTAAINISARNLREPGFSRKLVQLVIGHGLCPANFVLELTESSLFDDSANIADLDRLHGLGFALAIDDYGTGYSSLSYLRHLEVQEIKIDKSFVQGVKDHVNDLAIVESTIALAHRLDMKVVAEGVEDSATLRQLSWLGCDLAQGYFIGHPVDADILTASLSLRSRAVQHAPTSGAKSVTRQTLSA